MQIGRKLASPPAQRAGRPEQHARQERHHDRHCEDAAVEADLGQARHLGGSRSHQDIHTPDRQHQSCDATDHSQQHALGQQLAGQAPGGGPEGRPHRELAAPGGGAGQHEIRHVGAGDEQDQRDRAEQGEKHRAGMTDDLVGQGHHVGAPACIEVDVLAGQVRGDRSHFSLGLFGADAIPQAPDHHRVSATPFPVGGIESQRLPILVLAQRHRLE